MYKPKHHTEGDEKLEQIQDERNITLTTQNGSLRFLT